MENCYGIRIIYDKHEEDELASKISELIAANAPAPGPSHNLDPRSKFLETSVPDLGLSWLESILLLPGVRRAEIRYQHNSSTER